MKKQAVKILHPQMGQYRNYHFPPLVEPEEDLFGDDLSAGSGASYQDEFNDGFQDGQQKGFEQGYQEGLAQGQQAGEQQGLDQGRQQGVREGLSQVQQQMGSTVTSVDNLMQQIQQVFHQHVRQQSEMICDLVQKVSRQVIRAELTLVPSQMVNLIEETLAQMPEHKPELEVYLNPQDCQRLVDLVPEQVSSWNLKPDDSLAIGSCRVVTSDSEAFADSEERLEACMESIRDNLLTDA
ncbi:Flagellar assembly protein FliH [Photobacterium marinum]|uniref:Flagellar assembly protein FliH n=1 Tax=Photobacterium marinum TaxID=1056511 RepID=L8JE04_9GAMM|nr:flagellar assembly protein FliH [Photobacterium marinum]ELR67065.1 Flagellar assembly protein FliH [Photobacterium marinum]